MNLGYLPADDVTMVTAAVDQAPEREARLSSDGVRIVVKDGRLEVELDVLDEHGEVLRTFESQVDTGVVAE